MEYGSSRGTFCVFSGSSSSSDCALNLLYNLKLISFVRGLILLMKGNIYTFKIQLSKLFYFGLKEFLLAIFESLVI